MNKAALDDQIDLFDLVRFLWKNILAIVLAAVLMGSGMFAYTALMVSPSYQATAAMYVNNSAFSFGEASLSISAGELSASSYLVSVYLYILESRTTMEDVIREADLPYASGELSGMISAAAVSNTSAFEVTVTSGSPAEAELIANTIAKVLPKRISEIVDGTSVRIVDYAIIPAHRSGPNLMSNTVMGIMAGALLSTAVFVLLYLMNDRFKIVIQAADELRDLYPEIRVLAQIPDMHSRSGNSYYSSYYGSASGKKEERKNGKK